MYLSVPQDITALNLFAINVVSNARLALLMQIPAIPVLIQKEKCQIACVLVDP